MDPKLATVEASKLVKSEDILGKKWDKYLLDCTIKMTTGLAIGMYGIIGFLGIMFKKYVRTYFLVR